MKIPLAVTGLGTLAFLVWAYRWAYRSVQAAGMEATPYIDYQFAISHPIT